MRARVYVRHFHCSSLEGCREGSQPGPGCALESVSGQGRSAHRRPLEDHPPIASVEEAHILRDVENHVAAALDEKQALQIIGNPHRVCHNRSGRFAFMLNLPKFIECSPRMPARQANGGICTLPLPQAPK